LDKFDKHKMGSVTYSEVSKFLIGPLYANGGGFCDDRKYKSVIPVLD